MTNLINGCFPINVMLEKRYIKFSWDFFNSTHELHKAVAINCFHNQGSTLPENISYFMYKYNILIDDWHRPLSYLARKVYKNNDFLVNIDNNSIANYIINLICHRDNMFHCANIAFCSELNDILKILCTD